MSEIDIFYIFKHIFLMTNEWLTIELMQQREMRDREKKKEFIL